MPVEAAYVVHVGLAGIVMGSLGLLMIGHLTSERWLAPVRAEAEAAALTAPLLVVTGVPLALSLDRIFPWTGGGFPGGRGIFLEPGFFLARGAIYLALWSVLAVWLVRTRRHRFASAVGLALLTPTVTFAAYDWVLSREPEWWSGLFGFAFGASQLLAALAGAILITLIVPRHADLERIQNLERALLTLALLTLWMWFAQFLIVWLGDLPHETSWYLRRSQPEDLALLGAAFAALVAAVVILAPPGASRGVVVTGSLLVLAQHAAHMAWITRTPWPTAPGVAAAAALLAAWGAAFAILLRRRSREVDRSPL
jgi:hypothetical protein